jgi:plasmid stability protein
MIAINAILLDKVQSMPSITIRNVPEAVHRALRVRAVQHGRSTEAEIRDILDKAARPDSRVRLGSLLAAIGREAALTDDDLAHFAELRAKTPAEPPRFE